MAVEVLPTEFTAEPRVHLGATLPLWLSEELAVSLELEASYEETCHVLRIN